MNMNVWILPIALLVTTTAIAFPLSRYLAWIMDGKYKPCRSSVGPSNGWTAALRTGSSIRRL